jgi:hypothetical protein
MKKMVWVIAAMAVLASVDAQTRRIAHRSHGGANHERYDGKDGNFGLPPNYPRMVKVHLESGKDTIVPHTDSLARPYYLDSLRTLYRMPEPKKEIHNIHEAGNAAGKVLS